MRYTAIQDGHRAIVAAISGDELVLLTDVGDFYRNLPEWTTRARSDRASVHLSNVVQVPAVTPDARILCVGLDYRAHAAEGRFSPPDYPAVFGWWTHSLVADGQAIPALDKQLDGEGELAAIVGRKVADFDAKTALESVFDYAIFNDISARTFQRHTHQWTPGKNMDRSGVFGVVVSADEVGDPGDGLTLETRLDGTVMQHASTSGKTFSVWAIVSYLGRILTLHPGDVVVTGTPECVSYARTPPILTKPGETVSVSIDRVGTISSPIVGADRRGALS